MRLFAFLAQEHMPAFLCELDCFVFRTSLCWALRPSVGSWPRRWPAGSRWSASGTVVRATTLVHGETGFLAGTDREALDTIIALKNDPWLRARIGESARRAMEQRYSTSAWRPPGDYTFKALSNAVASCS